MRAHKTVHIDSVMLKLIQEAFCKSTFSIVAIDYQLSDPTHGFVIDRPTAGKCVTSKMAVDNNPDIRACGIIEQVLSSKPVFTKTYTTTCQWLADERKTNLMPLTCFCEFTSRLCRILAPNTVVFTEEHRGFL
jgi:hypothetical protein